MSARSGPVGHRFVSEQYFTVSRRWSVEQLPFVKLLVGLARCQQLACRPWPTIWPRSITTIVSADLIVLNRWAMTNVVRSCISASMACWIRCSLSASTWLVASSRIRIGDLAEDRAGDADALPLPAGQLPALLAEEGVVAERLFQDEVVGEGAAATSISRRGRRRPASPSPVPPAGGRRRCSRRSCRGRSPLSCVTMLIWPRRERSVASADVDAVDEDATLLRVVEPREEGEQRGLAAAVAADDRDATAPWAPSG